MVDPSWIEQALERNKARREHFDEIAYTRLTDALGGWPRGTVFLGGRAVPGYPSIGRVLNLEQGLKQHFQAPFHAEEKIDGFNVRIVRHADTDLAFSRGGFVCPFTTDRLPDLMDLRIFDDEPDLVICGEVAGPGNPYLEGHPPDIDHEVVLRIFDLMRFDAPQFMATVERHDLLQRYGLPAVPYHGRFHADQPEAVRALLGELDRRGVEGLVLKEEGERQKRAKYVTPASVVQDLRAMGDALIDMPPEYFTNRLLRLVLILEESPALERPELRAELGAALIDPLLAAARAHRDTHKVAHHFRCRFRSRVNAERFIEHMRRVPQKEIHSSVRSLEQAEDGYWVLTFDRVFPRISGLLGNFLSGAQVYD
ncbi:RNA ligase [Halorhodospira abdelmalekii]|uniref:RNA ligase n=1 Tax=Halorhodospira abdelmalekii TaxID=421629 RepID=UPI0019050664|nr:RNA ligase [Halorhodospira abdelmalekii]MBK1735790.1 RNA ligase [Halorhodospira abdelmalekii]